MSSFGLLFKRLDPEIKQVKPKCGWFSVWPAVHPLQGGSSPLRTLQRGVSGGHRLQGPNRASAERSVQEGGGPRAQGPRGQRAHGASVWGQRPGHKRWLRPQHQVRWRRWWWGGIFIEFFYLNRKNHNFASSPPLESLSNVDILHSFIHSFMYLFMYLSIPSYRYTHRCWSLKTSVCGMLLSGHTGTVTCLDVHSDHLVSGAKDCRVKGQAPYVLTFLRDVQAALSGNLKNIFSQRITLTNVWQMAITLNS